MCPERVASARNGPRLLNRSARSKAMVRVRHDVSHRFMDPVVQNAIVELAPLEPVAIEVHHATAGAQGLQYRRTGTRVHVTNDTSVQFTVPHPPTPSAPQSRATPGRPVRPAGCSFERGGLRPTTLRAATARHLSRGCRIGSSSGLGGISPGR